VVDFWKSSRRLLIMELAQLLSITRNAEEMIEDAGRTAYQSFDKKKKGSTQKFIRMLVEKRHESVLEHGVATVRIRGSRAFTHQLVRHRLCSYTQKSQRYVNEAQFNYIEPESIRDNEEAHSLFVDFMDKAKEVYVKLQQLGVKNEDARYVLPNAVETEIVVTANFRQWRHIIATRGAPAAQLEIRKVAIAVFKILNRYAPNVFSDFVVNEETATVSLLKPQK